MHYIVLNLQKDINRFTFYLFYSVQTSSQYIDDFICDLLLLVYLSLHKFHLKNDDSALRRSRNKLFIKFW